jgi:hypothetical protein
MQPKKIAPLKKIAQGYEPFEQTIGEEDFSDESLSFDLLEEPKDEFTEYSEDEQGDEFFEEEDVVEYSEDPADWSEEQWDRYEHENGKDIEPSSDDVVEYSEEVEDLDNLHSEDISEDMEVDAETPDHFGGEIALDESLPEDKPKVIPGSDVSFADDVPEEKEEPKETDWKNDRDVNKFMEYIVVAYPSGIPKHDGKSIVGCERAINYLNKLNSEISEALRLDYENVLDPIKLDQIRVGMMNDMLILKEHMKKLQKMIRDKHTKKADDSSIEIVKEATSARAQLVCTPFERAISGIIINSVISGGKPFDDVYEFLVKKYKLDDREQLAIMQLVADMGYPIFKDRASIGEKDQDDDSLQGLEFIKQYFA